MWKRFFTWLDTTQLTDPLYRQQAPLVMRLFMTLIITGFLSLFALFSDTMIGLNRWMNVIGAFLGFCLYAIAIMIIRRGKFRQGVFIGIWGLLLLNFMYGIPNGIMQGVTIPISFSMPVVLAGILISRRSVIAVIISSVVLISAIGWMEINGVIQTGYQGNDISLFGTIVFAVALLLSIVGIFTSLFGDKFRTLIIESQGRTNELEQLRGSLEQTVRERTASLEQSLAMTAQREQQLTETLVELQQSRETIRELSAPVLPVLDGVLVAPLVGALDEVRIEIFSSYLLQEVEQQRAHHVILDITGIPLVDTHVAQTLLRTADAVRLLGGAVVLVGVRPEVAQTLVTLGVDLTRLPTYANLREAIASLGMTQAARTQQR